MTNELKVFENEQFGEIRTLVVDGKVLFCGKDVALALGYKDTVNALKQHCRGVVKHHLIDSIGRDQETNFIPEGDVYRLAARSNLPGAEQFESWLFDEVVPSIRKTGGYIVGQNELSDDELLERALQVATRRIAEREQKIKEQSGIIKHQEETIELQDQVIGELKPKATYFDTILTSTDTVAIGQIAADYGLTANALNKILEEEKVQFKVNRQWLLTKAYRNLGYTESYTHSYTHRNGETGTQLFTRWTQKGRLFIHGLLESRNIKALMDIEE